MEKEIDGEYIVDTSIVAYEPQIKLKLQLAGGLFSSFFGGEALLTRVKAKEDLDTNPQPLRSSGWINPRLY